MFYEAWGNNSLLPTLVLRPVGHKGVKWAFCEVTVIPPVLIFTTTLIAISPYHLFGCQFPTIYVFIKLFLAFGFHGIDCPHLEQLFSKALITCFKRVKKSF